MITIRGNDIYILDAGYGKGKTLDYILKHKADVIFRLTPSHVRLIDKKGEKINMANRLNTKETVIELNCYSCLALREFCTMNLADLRRITIDHEQKTTMISL